MTPDAPGPGTPERRPLPLARGEIRVVCAVAVMVAALGLLGFLNSFAAVSAAARPAFGGLSPTVPLGTDLAIAAFSAMDIVLARLDMRPKWVRAVPLALTGATIYLNVAGQHTWFGRIAHAVFPLLWVLAVSLAAHVVRIRAQLDKGTRMDRIRASRWLLAPWSTASLWRRMILWEVTSYRAALDRERRRVLARTELQDAYGVIVWRWTAPRRVRALYRIGELAPTQDGPRTEPGGVPALDPVQPAPARTGPTRTRMEDHAGDEPGVRDGGGEAPLAELPRGTIVDRLADEIRDAIAAGSRWKPDYDALMTSTGRRRSWCEKVVRDARSAVLDPGGQDGGNEDSEPTTEDADRRLRPVNAGGDDGTPGDPLAVAS